MLLWLRVLRNGCGWGACLFEAVGIAWHSQAEGGGASCATLYRAERGLPGVEPGYCYRPAFGGGIPDSVDHCDLVGSGCVVLPIRGLEADGGLVVD